MSIINGFGNIPEDTAYAVNRFNIPTITYESDSYIFSLDIPFSYEQNKILNIQGISYNDTKKFINPYININGIGNKPVNGTIRSGKYYNLMWTGSEWVVQPTTLGVSTDPIIFTTSGTYDIDPDFSYRLIAVGGGGGAAAVYNSYYGGYRGVGSGGSGAKIEDTFIPTSDTITVTVGAAGANSSNDTGGNGGDTIIGSFTAGGGTGASGYDSSSSTTMTAGKGGTFSGGNGYNGKDGMYITGGSTADGTMYGGEGWDINGVIYGKGGSMRKWRETYEIVDEATPGIIILTPIL